MKLTHIQNARFTGMLLVALIAGPPRIANATLTHRYSFNETAGATLNDSVGTANGTVFGGDYPTWPGNGVMQLNGYDNYVQFPDNFLTEYTNVTIEAWVNDFGSAVWARVFDFGNQSGTSGSSWFYYTASAANLVRAEINPIAPSNVSITRPATAVEHHVAIVVDAGRTNMSIYVDGVLAGTKDVAGGYAGGNPSTVGATTNNWLGRSQFSADPYFWGAFNEFRIWDEPLMPEQIAASYQAGPDVVNANPGELTGILLTVPTPMIYPGVQQATLVGIYADLTNQVNLSNEPGVIYTSSDTNVIVVTNGTTLLAVGTGTATVTAIYAGKSNSKEITTISQSPVVVHRYSFSEAEGSTTVADSIGGADGTIVGSCDLGDGKVVLNNPARDNTGGYVNLPAGILSGLTNATFQFWVRWDGGGTGQTRFFDFGNNNGVNGLRWIFVSPDANNVANRRARFVINDGPGGVQANVSTGTPTNQDICVTAVFSDSANYMKLYFDGALVAQNLSVPKSLFNVQDEFNFLGKSQFAADATLAGTFDEFRVFDGAMDALTVAIASAAGPDQVVTNAGSLVALRIVTGSTNLDAQGGSVSFNVYADYSTVTNVNITTQPGIEISSSDPNIAVVSGTTLRPVGPGTATISVTFQSFTDVQPISVSATGAWPSLVHRYSFNESEGTTITDSISGANGTLIGAGSFMDGQLKLPGGAANSDGTINFTAGYVDLPNDLIATLPLQVTFEAWFIWDGGANNQRIFDFGNNDQIEDVQGTAITDLLMTPVGNGNVALITYRTNSQPDLTLAASAPVATGVPVQMLLTHDEIRNISKLFINGKFVASGGANFSLADIPQVNIWLGRSQWKDPYFSGSYDDFRIWNGAFTESQAAASYAAGANNIIAPSLSIEKSGANVVLRWPANATNFELQSTTSLSPAAWSKVLNLPEVTNGMNVLTVSPEATTFYRLH